MIIIPKNKIYNSYIIETSYIDNAINYIIDFSESLGFSKSMIKENSHPDFSIVEKEPDKQNISIKNIRDNIIDKIYTKPLLCDRKIFVIKIDTILSLDIQNTLLKTLEEPPSYISIFIVVKNKDQLLDTVRSRCFYIKDDALSDTLSDIINNDYIEDVSRVVTDLKYNDIYDIIVLSKTLSNIKKNDEYKKVLLYMLYLSRDALYYKNTFDKKNIVLHDKEVYVTSMAESYTVEAIGKLIDLLEDNISYVDSNVDKQLMIEDILMTVKKMLEIK